MKRLLLIFILSASVCSAHDWPRDDNVGLIQWSPSRPNISLGFGPIIDDLESMSTGLDANGNPHPMRNTRDVGNWAHEMTHQINSDFRAIMSRKKGMQYNCAYVLYGFAMSLPEPEVTLKQIAEAVPKDGEFYKTYLVDSRRYWNKLPLYILDESSAAANALYYQAEVKQVDNTRERLLGAWINYSNALVQTVEKFDSDYQELEKLRAFVVWHNNRARHLIEHHKNLTNPVKPYQIW